MVSTTNQEGVFRITGVPAGTTEIRVERLGYVATTQLVEVLEGETTVADFSLDVSAVALDAVVATATGPRRRREVGNSTSTIEVSNELENGGSHEPNRTLAGPCDWRSGRAVVRELGDLVHD